MTRFLFVICLFFSSFLVAQESFSEKQAKGLIDTFFEGFHEGDTLKMKSVMAENIVMQTAYTDKDGNNKINTGDASGFLNTIANRPESQKWDEKLLSYKISIDGNLAHVWTPYQFWFNGQLSHCGANAFTLAKTQKGWKIIHIIDSRRKEGCN